MAAKIYTSLEGSPNAIRLLQVLPGSGDEELKCHLCEAILGPDLTYTALSYAWENHVYTGLGTFTALDHGKQVGIYCNGKHIEIGSNLHSALRRLRNKNNVVQLWVDMLCIDQSDVTERNHQVALMRKIYESSQEVVIWLGDRPADRTDLEESSAFTMISRLAAGRHIVTQGVIYGGSIGADADDSYDLQRMMGVSWWRRIWVIQETVVSFKATIYYGDVSLPWTTFTQAATNYVSEMTSHPIDGYGMPGTDQLRGPLADFSRTVLEIEKTRTDWMSARPVTLLSLLRQFRSRESSDKRDKVFALLGLVTTWERVSPLLPDYALSVEEVLWRTTIKIISSTQSLEVLEGTLQDRTQQYLNNHKGGVSVAGKDPKEALIPQLPQWPERFAKLRLEQNVPDDARSTNGLQPLPSWVVDWTIPPVSAESERLSHLELFDASAGSPGLVQLHGASILEVQGFAVDELLAIGADMPNGFARMRALIDVWLRVAFPATALARQKEFKAGNILKGSQLEAFATTICGGLIYDVSSSQSNTRKKSSSYRRAGNSDLRAFRDWSNPDRYQNRRTTIVDGTWQGWTDAEANKEANSLHFAIETSSTGRSFFLGKQGFMGVGPPGVQKGDCICVVLGSRVPLILRPRAQTSSCRNERLRVLIRNPDGTKSAKECSECHSQLYTVVGDAYVHGIMDGEIVQEAQKRSELPISLYII